MKTRTITIIGILLLFTQFGFSQISSKSKNKKKEMEKTQFLGLRTTIYKVGDITNAKKWYSKAFGIEPYFDQPFYVGFNIGGFELGLQPEKEPIENKTENVITYWGVNDISEAYKKLIELGAIENEKPYNVGGEIITATVKDPFGNIIGIIYNPEFKK
ncbi:VOC family protein [Tenacibaculum sp. MEBiC06402]|uniref:VOC family protein n=1 Tax=unclassified Tenacibaculum TaxID=2635139 RepID=UPI003B9ACF7E